MKILKIVGGFIIGWVIASIITSTTLAILGMTEISSTTDTIKVTMGLIGGTLGTLIAYKKANPKNYED
jgi:hypothetical protein